MRQRSDARHSAALMLLMYIDHSSARLEERRSRSREEARGRKIASVTDIIGTDGSRFATALCFGKGVIDLPVLFALQWLSVSPTTS